MPDRSNTHLMPGYYEGRKGHVISGLPGGGGSIPEGALPINPSIVAQMKYESLKNEPLSKIWPIYGAYVVSGVTYISSAVLTYNLRRKLRLFSNGRVISYALALFGPSIMTGIVHGHFITDRIMEGGTPQCALCLPTKAACINVFTGWLMPTTMTFITASYMARASYTYKLPPADEFRPLVKALNKVSYRLRPLMGFNLLLAMASAFIVTYQEQQTINNVEISLQDYEESLQNLPDNHEFHASNVKW